MRLNIQKFASWEELTDYYNKNLNQTQQKINALQSEKQANINDYETNYANQLNEYKNLQEQQQNYINSWAANQKEQQQKQTDYNIGLIEQNKKEAAEETQKQTQDAYTDYMKQTNQYGGALENLASRGLATQGYAESSKVAMYNTYQNRVATANAALTKANTEYDNQIQQALLNNDAALAETALEQMKQSYQLALQGFDFTSNLYNQKITYLQNLENTYFDRETALRNQAATYAGEISSIKQYQEQLAEEKRQFNAQMNYKYSGSGGSGGSGGNGSYLYGDNSNTPVSGYEVDTPYYQGNYNSDVKYGTFSNGYQPDNINGTKLIKTGYTMELTTKTLDGQTKTITQNIWQLPNGTAYYWDGRKNAYVKSPQKIPSIIAKANTVNAKLKGKI